MHLLLVRQKKIILVTVKFLETCGLVLLAPIDVIHADDPRLYNNGWEFNMTIVL